MPQSRHTPHTNQQHCETRLNLFLTISWCSPSVEVPRHALKSNGSKSCHPRRSTHATYGKAHPQLAVSVFGLCPVLLCPPLRLRVTIRPPVLEKMRGLRLFVLRRDWSSLGLALSVAALATSGTLAFVSPGKLTGDILAWASPPRLGRVQPVHESEFRMAAAGALRELAGTAEAGRITSTVGVDQPFLLVEQRGCHAGVLYLAP